MTTTNTHCDWSRFDLVDTDEAQPSTGSWLDDVAPTEVVATPARWDAKDGWSLLGSKGTFGMIRRSLRKTREHFHDGKAGLAELAELAELVRIAQAVLDDAVRHELGADDGVAPPRPASYAEIAAALGVTQQAVAKRFRGLSVRPSGGQLSEDR